MRGLAILIFATVLLVVALGIAFFFAISDQNILKLVEDHERITAFAAVVAVILGTAATVGGAIATIQVANLGLRISRQQEARDSTQFLEERGSRAINLYIDALVALSDVIAVGILVNGKIPHLERDKLTELLDQRVNDDLGEAMVMLSNSLGELSKALRNLQKDDFAHFCYKNNYDSKRSILPAIRQRMLSHGFSESEAELEADNLTDMSNILQAASDRLKSRTYSPLIAARLATNLANAESVGRAYNNASVRSLFFTGNLIFNRTEQSKRDASVLLSVSYGAAILHDIFANIPTGKGIRGCLSKRYPNIAENVAYLLIEFNPEDVLATTLTYALGSLPTIGDLYFLEAR